MMLAMNVPVFSADKLDDSNVTVVNRSNAITNQELREIENTVGAHITLKDGETIPVDSIVIVEDVEPAQRFPTHSLLPQTATKLLYRLSAAIF